MIIQISHPIARVSTLIDVLNQDDLTNDDDDDAEFRQRIGAIEDNKLIEVITDKQPVFPLEVPVLQNQNEVKAAHFHNVKLVEWM